jgi:membrane associated rhomboid family serine protease
MTFREKQVLQPGPEADTAPVAQRRAPLPVVSWGIITLAVLRFLYDLTVLNNEVLLTSWHLNGPAIAQGEWWRLLGHAFVHGGGRDVSIKLLHIFFNMSAVFTLGMTLERVLGHWRFAIISAATCLGSAAAALFLAYDHEMVGASGMILGWAGVMLPIATRTGRRELTTWLVQVAVISLLPNVSWQGHLGGFLAGIPFGLALRAGPRVFNYAAPVILFAMAILAVVAARR